MKLVSRPPSEAGISRLRRIQPLSVLPVFLDLQGKRAVVAGGTDAAAWKAELLAAAGARIDLYAESAGLSPQMRHLLGSEPNITRHDRLWQAADLEGAHVAVADAEDDGEAAVFEAAARRAGAACNVIDRPDHCHFQFGSIVNRSPVVVGISTSGAAPILGQAIRRRIEALLPSALAEWAGLAQRLRDQVARRLAPGPARRAFWERLVDRAFGSAPAANAEAELIHAIDAGSVKEGRGHVTFVWAGSGDAELLTLKAVRALQAADLILFDDGVPDEVLDLARREAERIPAGRHADHRARKVDEMIEGLAQSGRRVVRLQSGNATIFGRLNEEIAMLEARGIGCEMVPGVAAPVVTPLRRALPAA